MNEKDTPQCGNGIIGSAEQMETMILRNLVYFPGSKATVEIARERSKKSIFAAKAKKREILLLTQIDPEVEEPGFGDVFPIGVIATIESCKKINLGNLHVVFKIHQRARALDYTVVDNVTYCKVEPLSDVEIPKEIEEIGLKKLSEIITYYVSNAQIERADYEAAFKDGKTLSEAVDYFAENMLHSYDEKQILLEELNPKTRCDVLVERIMRDIASIELEKELFSRTVASIKENDREHFLREQLKNIQNELRENSDGMDSSEMDDDNYYKKVIESNIPEEVKELLAKEALKLRKMPFGSMEASVLSAHISLCLELPWSESTVDNGDIEYAATVLERDHNGMEKVKERILEYLSVKLLKKEVGGQILCLVGAPGVGKTSVAKSIAEAMGKKYVRVSLGGIRDEAEIRGHRKTYVGAMPGRIITAVKNAGVNNPLILLDEIDKLTADSHGDPSSALLEVLDSEQNHSFRDHFVEYPFDLSECFFIATANTLSTIPKPLLDRMEVIELESYTEVEKLSIATCHLVPKQIKKHGLSSSKITFKEEAIMKIINCYTREAGVRNLEREIGSVCRKCAKLIVEDKAKKITVTAKKVVELLGAEYFIEDKIFDDDMIGCVNGLAWTSVGGEIMPLEAVSMDGNGKVELTGSLGNVMKESAMAAISYIRKHSAEFGIDPSFSSKKDIHIHAPEGAVPKDGPSAGIAMTTAILSELTGRKVKRNVAMTGEITLTGRVLPIGGLKEKTMAAYKAGVTLVILPEKNRKDIMKLDNFIKEKLEFAYVSNYMEVVKLAFAD